MSNEFGNGRIARYSSHYQLWFILKKLFLLNKGKISPMILGWTELDPKSYSLLKVNFIFPISCFLPSVISRDFASVKDSKIIIHKS